MLIIASKDQKLILTQLYKNIYLLCLTFISARGCRWSHWACVQHTHQPFMVGDADKHQLPLNCNRLLWRESFIPSCSDLKHFMFNSDVIKMYSSCCADGVCAVFTFPETSTFLNNRVMLAWLTSSSSYLKTFQATKHKLRNTANIVFREFSLSSHE